MNEERRDKLLGLLRQWTAFTIEIDDVEKQLETLFTPATPQIGADWLITRTITIPSMLNVNAGPNMTAIPPIVVLKPSLIQIMQRKRKSS